MGSASPELRMSGRALAISASARGMAEDSSSSRQMKKTTKTMVYKTDSSGNVTTHTDVKVEGSSASESAAFRRYEEQIRVLQEDLDSEMSMRRRIEHEKQNLQMQIISLSERLTEGESGSESQLEINRKREAEMAKLRKLLEDVHNESEQQIHTLRTKHQTSMMELQEQIERMSREKEKVVKEKSVMKTEISELYAQIEILQSEKISIKKVVEKLEITVNEYHLKIEDLTAAYDDVNKKLGASVQQYDITIKRLTAIEAEFKSLTVTYNNTLKIVKDYEGKMGGLNKQVSELTSANNSLSQFKVKIEKELAAVTRDYQDIAKELKLADDRANKAAADAGHFESLLREEQTKVVKIDSAKKALENEVRSLSVKIEEIETNSVATSKRTIQKMEIRIQELEVMINEEKKSHASTMSELHTKTRSIKELVLQSEEDRKNIIILQTSRDIR